MTIWILAFLTLALAALAGWRQGAIRAAITFAGIFVAALLAVPLGKMFHPLLPHLGASNPILAWALAPVAGFIFVSIIFAVVAFNVHRKVEVFYKYQAGDLRQARWSRLNSRLGICLGLLNGAVYFVLLCFVIFNLAYFTTQVSAASEKQSGLIRLVNQLGRDLQSTGLAKSATAVGTLPPMYYQLADL
ncbi:MAG TPA: CvpA family protein, partial [Verrucomicrobiae bacterium]